MDDAHATELLGGVQLLPFLDIVFSLVGIFLVVFVLQSIHEQARTGLAGVDELMICEDGRSVWLHAHPGADPLEIPAPRLRDLKEYLPASETVGNLSFAFGAGCFATKLSFQRAFAQFSQDLQRQGGVTRRLNFRPLGSEPDAGQALLDRWRRAREQR